MAHGASFQKQKRGVRVIMLDICDNRRTETLFEREHMKRLLIICSAALLTCALWVQTAFAAPAACVDCGSTSYYSSTNGVNMPVTCTSDGYIAYFCANCDNYLGEEQMGALGHDFSNVLSVVDPDCTHEGSKEVSCTRCRAMETLTLSALGHNYTTTTIQQPGCTTNGLQRHTCTRCSYSYNSSLSAYGHNMQTTITEPDCTKEGSEVETCTYCGISSTKVLEPLGHDYVEESLVEATETADGLRVEVCSRCGDRKEEVLPKLVVAPVVSPAPEPEAKDEFPIVPVAVGGGVALVVGVGIFLALRARDAAALAAAAGAATASTTAAVAAATPEAAVAAGAATTASGLGISLIELDTKRVALYLAAGEHADALRKCLRSKSFLKLIEVDYGNEQDLFDTIETKDIDVALIQIDESASLEDVKGLMERIDDACDDADLALLLPENLLAANKDYFATLQKDGDIVAFASSADSPLLNLAKLFLPIYKEDFTLQGGVEGLASVAGSLGIPFVAEAAELFWAGRDIKENVDKYNRGTKEYADIAATVASVLGWGEVEAVSEFVKNVATAKKSLGAQGDRSAHDLKSGASAVKDIAGTLLGD